jgi:hypothetical protein
MLDNSAGDIGVASLRVSTLRVGTGPPVAAASNGLDSTSKYELRRRADCDLVLMNQKQKYLLKILDQFHDAMRCGGKIFYRI